MSLTANKTPLQIILAFLLEFFYVFIEPLLCHLSFTRPGGIHNDPTYGRASLPYSESERKLIYENPKVKVVKRTVELKGEAMRKGGSWDKEGTSWVSYCTWEIPEAVEREKLKADVVVLHGLNDYSGKLAPHAYRFMEAGFRVIAVDLPSFGRSTGLHAYLPSMRLNVEAAHSVIKDVYEKDHGEEGRKLFLEGHSMGGFTALYYAALYPPLSSTSDGGPTISEQRDSRSARPNLSGVIVAAPMISISPQSRPSYLVELIARGIIFFAGRLPLARAVRGNVSDDPRVDLEHDQDPQTYHGLLRISTGMAVLAGLAELQDLAPRITCPLAIHHGANDRATSANGSKDFFERVGSQDRTLRIWDGYEHVMMKNVKGMSQADEKKREAVLSAITEWLVAQARK